MATGDSDDAALDEAALDDAAFGAFARSATPRLVRSLVALRGVDGAQDAAAEALAHAWANWDRVRHMDHPIAYLHRVGLSKSRTRKQAVLPAPAAIGVPDVEPGLLPALLALSESQRTAVWLVHGCGWTQREVAEAMDVAPTTVATHLERGIRSLRTALEAHPDA